MVDFPPKSMFSSVIDKLKGYLKDLPYPITKEKIITEVKKRGAPEWAITILDRITDKTYKDESQVTKEVQKQKDNASSLNLKDPSGLKL